MEMIALIIHSGIVACCEDSGLRQSEQRVEESGDGYLCGGLCPDIVCFHLPAWEMWFTLSPGSL